MSSVLDETSIRTSRPGLTQANVSRSLERPLGRHGRGRRRLTYAWTGRRAWSRHMNAHADDQRHDGATKTVGQVRRRRTMKTLECLDRNVCSGLCNPNQLALNELIADIDDKLFFQAMYNNCHVLNSLLPNETHRTYNLRQRRHNRTLLTKQYTVTESHFIVRKQSENKDIH